MDYVSLITPYIEEIPCWSMPLPSTSGKCNSSISSIEFNKAILRDSKKESLSFLEEAFSDLRLVILFQKNTSNLLYNFFHFRSLMCISESSIKDRNKTFENLLSTRISEQMLDLVATNDVELL